MRTNHVRTVRLARQMRQDDVTELTGIAREHISRIEGKKCWPNARTRQKIATALGLEEHLLFPEDQARG